MFEKLTVEEETEVRAGVDESLPLPDICEQAYSFPPARSCVAE